MDANLLLEQEGRKGCVSKAQPFYRFENIAETGIDSPIPKPHHAKIYTCVTCKIISRSDSTHAIGKSANGNEKQ